jgi:5-formyltetrahydrofolate cyclo-ligase
MKEALRREARGRLRGLSPEGRVQAGAAIARRVWRVPQVAGARHLLVYAALPSEVPTAAIVEEARRRGIVTVFPRCLPDTREMALHRLGTEDPLHPGAHGIREPDPACPLVTVDDIDAALLPGLAWDRAGGRLGRGAGYYDRLLGSPAWKAFACGLFFAAQEMDAIPMDRWDARLQAVVTEKAIVNCEL